jgi:thioredoxin-like negative regulator of GroEL
MEENSKKNYGDPADVMLLLAKEAEDVVASAGKSAQQQAEEETQKWLRQYEQRAKQIVLKIREESRARADEMAARFREALILRVEEASTAAIYETINGVGAITS